MTDSNLEQFDQAMRGIYDAARKLKPPYHATYFLRMVNEHGGKETANRLLATNRPSEGFTELFLRGRGPSEAVARSVHDRTVCSCEEATDRSRVSASCGRSRLIGCRQST